MSETDPMLGLDLSGISIAVHGGDGIVERLSRHWVPYRAPVPAEPFLRCRVERQRAAPLRGAFDPKAMRAEFAEGAARFVLPEGVAEIDGRRHCSIRVTEGDGNRVYYGFLNLLRAALAWCLPDGDALLVHAACVVIDERAFVLVGPPGAGKSTWAALAEQAGATVLGDDSLILAGEGDHVAALGLPQGGIDRPHPPLGRWPVAAILLPHHGGKPGLEPVSRSRLHTRLVANLPFLAEAIGVDARPTDVVQRLSAGTAAYRLTFAREPSFVALLRRLPPSATDRGRGG